MARKTNTKKRRTMEDILKAEEVEVEEVAEEETEGQPVKFQEGFEPKTDESVEVPPPNVQHYDYEEAQNRIAKGIKVCRSIWHPACFLLDYCHRSSPEGAFLPWNPGQEDKKAADWMDYAVRMET